MLPGILAKSASYLPWFRPLLKLIDLLPLPNRLTVHRVLEPFDHRFEVLKAFLDDVETLRHRRLLLAGIGRGAH
jgi:hypothetical protein